MADDAGEEKSSNCEEFVTICATATVGLERICATECETKLSCHVWLGRGRVYFRIPRKSIMRIKDLRSVENLFVVVADLNNIDCLAMEEPVQSILERFYHLPEQIEWESGLDLWKEFTGHENVDEKPGGTVLVESELQSEGSVKVQADESDNAKENEKCEEPIIKRSVPSFRVTCTRTHSVPSKKHVFSSMEAACQFGGGINDFLGWKVDLTNFDLEVLLNVVDNQVVVGISLTKESLFRRNIVHFGPTTLRSTLAYCLAMVAEIKPGDIVCDPLCGGGSISLECATNWVASFNLCGDNFDAAPSRTLDNVNYVNEQRANEKRGHIALDTLRWDATHLPLRTKSIDVLITDLPFGKKSGSLMKNWELYPQVLTEMARVCQPGTGRAVLLTKDKKVITKVLAKHSRLWKKKYTYWINFGGLQAGIYVLQRTLFVAQ